MAALDFPTSPTNGQFYQGYVWNSTNGTWDSSYQADTVRPGITQVVAPTVRVSGGSATANSLGTVSFTAATSISLDSVFTSKYANYRIYLKLATNTASASIGYRYRVSGADNTSSSYFFGGFHARTSGAAPGGFSSGGATATSGTVIWANGAAYGESAAVLDIASPNQPARTIAITSGHGHDATSAVLIGTSCYFTTAVVFDGITFLASTGTMTGTVTVYGYEN